MLLRRLARSAAIAVLMTVAAVGLVAQPAQALPIDRCQHLANLRWSHMNNARIYFALSQYYHAAGAYDDARQAATWSVGYSRLAEQAMLRSRAAGC
jgi:hypothetical protein